MSSAAAAVGASPAVAGQKQTLDDLQKIADAQPFKHTKVSNNQYLKWSRFKGEEPRGVPIYVGSLELDLGTVFDMGCLYHEKKGPWFSFTDSSVDGEVRVVESCAIHHGVADGLSPQNGPGAKLGWSASRSIARTKWSTTS